ncbi:unnamed protein product [Camellia sinensis]
MPSMGMVPNVVTYTTVLGGYVSRVDMVSAKKVFDEILDRGWVPDAMTYTILMDGFCKQGRLIDAVKVMDDMDENGVEPNDVTYGIMIEAYCKEKKPVEALNLLNDMLKKKYVPSLALCCRVIDALFEEGKVENACDLWNNLLKNNCTPDNAISSTLIHWLCKEGKIWEARKLFSEFERGSIPSVLTYNTLIAGMCVRGELREAGREVGFCKVGYPREGIRVLEEMLEKGCLPNKSTYSILTEGLCDLGMEADVTTVLSMAAASVEIDTDSWGVFIGKVARNLDSRGSMLDKILLEFSTPWNHWNHSNYEKEIKYFNKWNSLGTQPLEPLQSFICPITREVMVDPVETSSGHTFERSSIEKWFADGNNLCPLTMIPLGTSILWPNKTLRQSIEEWKDRNTMITIASMKPKLLVGEDEEVLHCLGQLQDLYIRNHALVILCILAKDSDDAKERVANVDNAIESIVRSLGPRIAERKLAMALLLELSKSEIVQDCIGKVQGCILHLVTVKRG